MGFAIFHKPILKFFNLIFQSCHVAKSQAKVMNIHKKIQPNWALKRLLRSELHYSNLIIIRLKYNVHKYRTRAGFFFQIPQVGALARIFSIN